MAENLSGRLNRQLSERKETPENLSGHLSSLPVHREKRVILQLAMCSGMGTACCARARTATCSQLTIQSYRAMKVVQPSGRRAQQAAPMA